MSVNWKVVPVVFGLHFLFTAWVVWRTSVLFPEFAEIGFPISFDQAKALSQVLTLRLETNYYDLLLFECAGFILYDYYGLQVWSIPGTFFFNLLGGALFGMKVGYAVCVICNTLGALMSFMLSKLFLGEIVRSKFTRQLEFVRNKINEHRKDLLFYMLSLRAFPTSPSWLMNLTYPHVGVPIPYFITSVAVGLAPWNFFACKAGVFISQYSSKAEIMDTDTYMTLLSFAAMFLLVPLGRKLYNKMQDNKKKVE